MVYLEIVNLHLHLPRNKILAPLQTLTQQTCPPLPIDANGKCPGIDARGGGLGLPPVPPNRSIKEVSLNPDGSCDGAFDPRTNKCYEDNFHAPPCPGKCGSNPNAPSGGRDVYGLCGDPNNDLPPPSISDAKTGICRIGGVHIATAKSICFVDETSQRAPDGSCLSGYFATGDSCRLKIHDPLPDGSCPSGYHNIPAPTAPVPRGTLCKLDILKLTNDDITSELPGGYCPAGYRHVYSDASTSLKCFRNS